MIDSILVKTRQWFFGLLFILVPLILTPWNYELFEYNKMMIVYGLTVLILATWVIPSARKKQFVFVRTPFDIPIAAFVLSQLVSALFSTDPHVSWFGYYSRFNGSMLSVIAYTILFFISVSHFTSGKQTDENKTDSSEKNQNAVMLFFRTIVFTGTVVAFYGLLERMGIDKHLWVQDVQSRVFSTLGQPNWLAAYLVAISPIAWFFTLKSQISHTDMKTHKRFRIVWNWEFILWSLTSLLFFFVLLSTRSRSGLLGFAVAEGIFWGTLFIQKIREQLSQKGKSTDSFPAPAYTISFLVIHFLFAGTVFLNGSYIDAIDKHFTLDSLVKRITARAPIITTQPDSADKPSGTLLEYGGTESGTIRKYVWQAAITAWKSTTKTFLIGTGTETFAWAFFRFRPVAHNLTSEWDYLYNKAHNEYLNYLTTTGIFGLGSYLVFIMFVIGWFIRSVFLNPGNLKSPQKYKNYQTDTQHSIHTDGNLSVTSQHIVLTFLISAIFAGWSSILITNFFGFSVVIIQLFFFLFPIFLFILTVYQKTLLSGMKPTFNTYTIHIPDKISPVLPYAMFALGVFLIFRLSAFWYADTLFARGYRLNHSDLPGPARPLFEHAISLNPGEPLYHDELAGSLASLAVQAIASKDTTNATTLINASISESNTAILTSPVNVNFWKTRTKIFYALSAYDQKAYDAAIDALTQARVLSPNDPKILYNLAVLYGQGGKTDKAIETLKETKAMKPNYKDAYYALFVFYNERKDTVKAKTELTEYLTKVDPTDTEFKKILESL